MSNVSVTVNYHVRPDTEIRLSRQNSGTTVLEIGSTAHDSPSGAVVYLYFDPKDADLRRLRDAINAHLGDTDSDLLREVASVRDALQAADLEAVAANRAGMLAVEAIYNDLSAAVATAVARLDALLPGGAS